MELEEQFRKNLADFHNGADDLARAPADFIEWRDNTAPFQALYERQLLEAVGPTTKLAGSPDPHHVINMASLDYLGMCRHEEVIRVQQQALSEWGNGAAGVPLLSGTATVHKALEEELRTLCERSGAMLFSSGFVGALGVGSGLLRRGDVAIVDERAHISWMDGARMGGAKLVPFTHNDPDALDRALEQNKRRRRVVVVDGLYSMDGDFANLSELLTVTEAHDVGLVVDEAHSIFAAGENGGGVTEAQGQQRRVRLLLGTFSKALSMVGGFLSGDEDLIDYLRYYSHPYAFSSALPPALVTGLLAAAQVAREAKHLRRRLEENATYFRQGLSSMGLSTGLSQSWVVPIIVGDRRRLLYEGVTELMRRGLYVAPVDFPAVSEDQLRIRCAVSAAHERAHLDRALELIESVIARPLNKP